MRTIPDALASLGEHAQFILYKLVPGTGGKTDKIPINPHTCRAMPQGADWQNDPQYWADGAAATAIAAQLGPEYGAGFLFRDDDPFFFLDIDDCLQDGQWSPLALELINRLAGAAVEVSQSGRGLHIIGRYTGAAPEHGCKNIALGLELYTGKRFAALTGARTVGSASTDCTQGLHAVAAEYFPPSVADVEGDDWRSEPVPEWSGPEDDNELLSRALRSRSAGSAFGGSVAFAALWAGDEQALSGAYQDDHRSYDASSADAALAQHLAFWTGKNHERIQRLMWLSGLVRDKWEQRPDYLPRTIQNAVALQRDVLGEQAQADTDLAERYGACKLRASSDGQRQFANNVRAQKLAECPDTDTAERLARIPTARFWLDNKHRSVDEIVGLITPVEHAIDPHAATEEGGPKVLQGFQFLGASQQMEYFAGCVYVQDEHRVFTPDGLLLKPEQFRATYGGYSFQLDDGGEKTTRNAWEAFTESQVVRYPKAQSTCFRPKLAPGALVREEGRVLVNTYVPVRTLIRPGDPSPFLEHLARVLPNEHDQSILLAYMAACIQHKGEKFQWAPLLQGMQGNGKTLFTRVVAHAIGERYTHMPPAGEIAEKFNDWLFGKLFIGVEDVYVPEHRREVIETLKPMITGSRLSKRAMQQSQVMDDVCANFILNSNHKDAIRTTLTDRRFAVFFTNQQNFGDLARDGMDGDYFPWLYEWLKGEGRFSEHGPGHGYAVVAHYLEQYDIPDELNPAGACHRAPETSSTQQAVAESLGTVEQEIMEAIDEGRTGFAGGWVSSVAIERLLQSMHATRTVPPNRRREMMQGLGYDWHPALRDGRVNNPVPIDDGKKPRLFIKRGHIHANLETAAEVVKTYQEAQGAEGVVVADKFGAQG